MKVSYEDVVAAVVQLEAAGQRVSVNSVRELLGRGSKSTIVALLQRYRSETPSVSAERSVDTKALALLERALIVNESSLVSSLRGQIADGEKLAKDLAREYSILEEELANSQAQYHEARDQLATFRGISAQKDATISSRDARISDLEKAVENLKIELAKSQVFAQLYEEARSLNSSVLEQVHTNSVAIGELQEKLERHFTGVFGTPQSVNVQAIYEQIYDFPETPPDTI